MSNISIYYGHPRHLEQVLMITQIEYNSRSRRLAWVPDIVLMAWKYDNLYIDYSAHRPKYIAMPGTGWEMFSVMPTPLFRTRSASDRTGYPSACLSRTFLEKWPSGAER
jgi:hypothetical protein